MLQLWLKYKYQNKRAAFLYNSTLRFFLIKPLKLSDFLNNI